MYLYLGYINVLRFKKVVILLIWNDEFYILASTITHQGNESTSVAERTFSAFFGTTAQVCLIYRKMRKRYTYSIEHVNETLAQVDQNTFRKWSCKIISKLSYLQLVSCFKLFLILPTIFRSHDHHVL